jgi:hypothetical protein
MSTCKTDLKGWSMAIRKGWVRISEAASLVGRSKVNVCRWVRLGYLPGEYLLTGPRSRRGLLHVPVKQLMLLASVVSQGVRMDVEPLEVRSSNRLAVIERDDVGFEDWQLEVARKVFA